MKIPIILILIFASFGLHAQFKEKLSFRLEYGACLLNQRELNTIIQDTNLYSLGIQNEPRSTGFKTTQYFGLGFNLRCNRFLDFGIVGSWQSEHVEHQGFTSVNNGQSVHYFRQEAFHRLEIAQLGLNGHYFIDALLDANLPIEFGAEWNACFTQTEYENHIFYEDLLDNGYVVNQSTAYRGKSVGFSGRLGLFVGYGIEFERSRLGFGVSGGYQFGGSAPLSNAAGTSILHIYDQTAAVNFNGAYGALFLKFSR